MKYKYEIVEYKGKHVAHFTEKVREYLNEGWRIFGGVSVVYIGDNLYLYSQVVVRMDEDEE